MSKEVNLNPLYADVASLQAVTKVLEERLENLTETVRLAQLDYDALAERFMNLEASHAALLEESRGALYGYEVEVLEDESEEQRATRVGLVARVQELESLLRGRNRSAPTKRNMTDEDAERVLTGDVATLGHKEAGEAIGLTYAQVYSCRLEYTFKHVHKKLRDNGWKNAFVK